MIQSTSVPQAVADEVWAEIGPARPPVMRLAVIVGILGVVFASLVVAWHEGVIVPHLQATEDRTTGSSEITAAPGSRRMLIAVPIWNAGRRSVRVLAVGRDEKGLRVISSEGFRPFTLGSHEHRFVRLHYEIVDCDLARQSAFEIPVKARALFTTTEPMREVHSESFVRAIEHACGRALPSYSNL